MVTLQLHSFLFIKIIKDRRRFWLKKFEYNRKHDEEVNRLLTEKGWKIVRFTDKEVKKNLDGCIDTILSEIGKKRLEINK